MKFADKEHIEEGMESDDIRVGEDSELEFSKLTQSTEMRDLSRFKDISLFVRTFSICLSLFLQVFSTFFDLLCYTNALPLSFALLFSASSLILFIITLFVRYFDIRVN